MSIQKINADEIEKLFKDYLADPQYYFVFSTDVVKNSWIDWIVTHPQESGVSAVAMERFLAWDTFKSQYVKGTEESKSSIPAILRKFYIQNLIEENAKEPFFKRIINPQYKDDAQSFTNWITRLLPSLKQWYELRTSIDEGLDEEDQDYEILYNRYSAFLEKNSLFEPAWIQSDFSTLDKKFVIFFPEILEDYCDYDETLSSNENIVLVELETKGTEENGVACYEYSDSRKELRRTLLQIRQLAENGVDFQNMALNVPDLETYRPYLEREFKKYCIPYVIRAGIPLISGGEGGIFTKILDCYSSNFSYNSVRAIVLDDYIPWKPEYEILRENLVQAGCDMRCLCSYEKDGKLVDIWEKALHIDSRNTREEDFYKKLKNEITRMCEASTFRGILQAWEKFKELFLDCNDFTDLANNIISRCIIHLQEFIQIEENFFQNNDIKIRNPYQFFITELSSKTYTPQSKTVGLNVYPYRLAAAAKIEYQFVIDSSQNNLEVVYKKMNFLNNEKRKALKLIEKDKKYNPTKAFITLYNKGEHKNLVTFSYAQDTFQGFAISHNFMNLAKDAQGNIIENPLQELDKQDFIYQETKGFLSKKIPANFSISENQKQQFEHWYNINKPRFKELNNQESLDENMTKAITYTLVTNRSKNSPECKKIVISQSDMKNFFQCPRKWLFSNVIKLQEDSLDISLIGPYDMGNINHKILELFMEEYVQNQQPLPILNEQGELPEKDLFAKKIMELTDQAITECKKSFHDSPLVVEMLTSQKAKIADTLMAFLHTFLGTYGGHYVNGVEKSIDYEPVNKPYKFYGKIDNLLSNMEESSITGGWEIVDYKNSSSALPAKGDCFAKTDSNGNSVLNDFQMPMYISLLKGTTNKEIIKAGFYAINNPEKTTDVISAKTTFTNFEDTMDLFEKYTDTFNEKIENQDFDPASAQVTAWDDCGSCSFKSICRHSYTIAGKNIKGGN